MGGYGATGSQYLLLPIGPNSEQGREEGERGGEPSYPKLDADKHDGSEFGDDLALWVWE